MSKANSGTRARKGIAVLLPTVALVLGMVGCSGKPESDESESAKAQVTLVEVKRADVSETITLTGTAAALPNDDVRASALVAGRVAELNVAEGDRVEAGEVVAKLDDRTYRDQLRQATAALDQAKANLENAKLSRARNEGLFERGIVARKDLEDSRTEESVAAAALEQAQAAEEIARLAVARSEIVSPLDGVVAKRFVSVGEQVDGTAAQPIVELADLREIEFIGNPAAAYLGKIKAGDRVDVTSEALAGETFPGRVVATSPSVDPSTGVGSVRIRIPNPHGLLRLGMFLTADIAIETHHHVLVAPQESVYRNEEGLPRVFVVKGNSATAAEVKLGIETKGEVELAQAQGVKEGDTIILSGGYGLGDQADVETEAPEKQ